MNATNDSWEQLPADLRRAAEAHLAADESPLAWFELDLDTRLHYARGLLVLTRVAAAGHRAARGDRLATRCRPPELTSVRSWPLDATSVLRVKDQNSAGRLELLGPSGLLCHWRYTIGRSPLAHRLANRFQRLHDGELSGGDETGEAPTTICPSCGAILAAGQIKCPDCGSVGDKPAFGALYRLAAFAKPHKWMVLLRLRVDGGQFERGVGAALLHKVVDQQRAEAGREHVPGSVSFSLVWLFLFAFVGASVLAWLLTWGRTYVMAWVSERITTDLRDRTYGHMQGLSLEFFGGKRTGDLISRVSTDSDRICYFLSVYLLDFANNILMLVLIAVILSCLDAPAGPGDASPAADHRVSRASGARPDAARLRPGHSGMGRNDQRAGRHDPRHPRRQGVRPGTSRNRAISHGKQPRVPGQLPRQHTMGVF